MVVCLDSSYNKPQKIRGKKGFIFVFILYAGKSFLTTPSSLAKRARTIHFQNMAAGALNTAAAVAASNTLSNRGMQLVLDNGKRI